jgi:predicted Zn-dependent protease
VALGEDGAALRGLSHALSAAGQAEEALPFAARAVAAAPGEALNHAWQGALLAQLGQRDAAAASLRDALARDAGQVLAHRSLVETLLAAGRRAEAAAALHAARAACPGHPLLDGLLAEEPEGVAPAAPPGLLQRLGAALRRG